MDPADLAPLPGAPTGGPAFRPKGSVMSTPILVASCLAGFTYGILPGPAVLAVFGIGAARGRRAGATFLAGHFVGDVIWVSLALVAILGARAIGTLVFDILGLLCGVYLFHLGWRAATVRRRADGVVETDRRPPLAHGLVFGLTNPKGYPVAVATFTAILAGYSGALTWSAMPGLLAAAAIGFVSSYAILIGIVGAGPVRRVYQRYEIWIVRASGLLFIGYALNALFTSGSALLARRT